MWKLWASKITNQKKSFDFEKNFGNLNKIFRFNVDLTQGITKYYKNVMPPLKFKLWWKNVFMNNMLPRIDS
jgi:hypothetical protein